MNQPITSPCPSAAAFGLPVLENTDKTQTLCKKVEQRPMNTGLQVIEKFGRGGGDRNCIPTF